MTTHRNQLELGLDSISAQNSAQFLHKSVKIAAISLYAGVERGGA
jgi:hypothetical protein